MLMFNPGKVIKLSSVLVLLFTNTLQKRFSQAEKIKVSCEFFFLSLLWENNAQELKQPSASF